MKRFLHGALAACISSVALAQEPALQVDWIQSPINGHWYGVDYTEQTWAEARDTAATYGFQLATVTSTSMQQWLPTELASYIPFPAGAWLGLEQDEQAPDYSEPDGGWYWVTGESLSDENWRSGDPNNQVGGTERVAATQPDGLWFDAVGVDPRRPVIESGSQPTTGWSWPEYDLPDGWPVYGNLVDLDGDGDLDYASPNGVCCSSSGGKLQTFLNDGSGNLNPHQSLPVAAGSAHAAVAVDHDQDGDSDIVATFRNKSIYLFENDGTGNLQAITDLNATVANPPVLEWPQEALVMDWNRDGLDDLVVAGGYFDTRVALFSGSSQGGFAFAQYLDGMYSPNYLCAADLDQDGIDDLVVSYGNELQSQSGIRFYAGITNGGFATPVELPWDRAEVPQHVLATHLNNDGAVDLVVSGVSEILTYESGVAGQFAVTGTYPTGGQPRRLTAADFDGDGHSDIAVPCATGNSVYVFYGDGTGNLTGTEIFTDQPWALSCSAGDLDGNASPDLVVARHNDPAIAVWKNHRVFDCNQNGLPDPDDIATGTSQDCNANGIPDECDVLQPGLDCDANGLLDSCELAAGTAIDCDTNGLIDSCEIAAGTAIDCDFSNTIDACDIANGTSQDCNANGVPDSCDLATLDCDANGLVDSCELAAGTATDCDANGLIDSCEIAADAQLDRNQDAILDACQYVISNYCLTSSNTSGNAATMSSSGLPSVVLNEFTLEVQGAALQKFGLFFIGPATQSIFVGEGLLCVSDPQRIYPLLVTDATGAASLPLDLTSAPLAGTVQAFDTHYFQFWFRDPLGGPAGFNFSDGLEVEFCQ